MRQPVSIVVAMVAVAAGCARPVALPAEVAVLHSTSPVTSVAFAKTGALAATLSQDHKLRIVTLPDGAERRAIDLGDRAVDVFALSPDGLLVAIGDHKGAVSVWDTTTGQSRLELHLAHYPGLGVFSHNGAVLAVAAQGDPVQLIDIASGRLAATLGAPTGGTMALAFSRDDRLVTTADGDAAVRIHDARTGVRIAENRDFLLVPLAVDFTADGASVIAGGGDKVVLFIDASNGRTIRKMDRTAQPVAFLEVSPDGASFGTAFMKSENMTLPDRIVVWASKTGQQEAEWLPQSLPAGAGWTRDGRLIVAIAAADGVHLWRVR